MKLRHYQDDAKARVFAEWETNVSTLVVLPTGVGKTVLFASIIKDMQPKRALVIAHREELIWQARDKIEGMVGLSCEIEMGELYANASLFHETPVVISTVQTQNASHGTRKRMGRFKPEDFGLLILDECHHSTAKSYKDLISYYRQNPALKVLGVTATPDRTDEEALGQIFDTVAFDYEILDAIHDGWLVPIEQQFVHVNGLDFSACRTTAGDLNGADLAAVMEAEQNLQGVAGAAIQIIGKRRAIVFTASVHQAEVLCTIFNRHNPLMASWVCGKTNKDDRRTMLKRFADNEVQIIVNCGVLTEGFDDAGVECIIMARPTKSRSLYAQMAGRATRPLTGLVDPLEDRDARKRAILASSKPSCLIIDFVGNSGRHKLMTSADILGGKVSDEAIERAIKMAEKMGKSVNMAELLDEEEDKIREEIKKRLEVEEARKAKLLAKVKYSSKRINPFDVWDIDPVYDRGWDKDKHLSEKQRQLLMKQGVDPDTMNYASAKALLNEMFRRWHHKLCTLKQSSTLQRYGYETSKMTMEMASKTLDGLAKNGWKRPSEIRTAEPAMPKPEPQYEEQTPFV